MRPVVVNSPNYPPMRARISHAKVHNGICYVSGMVGREPKTGVVVPGGMAAQTRQTLENLKDVLETAGTSLDMVITTNCYVSDMTQFDAFNAIWEQYFPTDPPTRICIQVVLGPSFDIEIDAIAAMP